MNKRLVLVIALIAFAILASAAFTPVRADGPSDVPTGTPTETPTEVPTATAVQTEEVPTEVTPSATQVEMEAATEMPNEVPTEASTATEVATEVPPTETTTATLTESPPETEQTALMVEMPTQAPPTPPAAIAEGEWIRLGSFTTKSCGALVRVFNNESVHQNTDVELRTVNGTVPISNVESEKFIVSEATVPWGGISVDVFVHPGSGQYSLTWGDFTIECPPAPTEEPQQVQPSVAWHTIAVCDIEPDEVEIRGRNDNSYDIKISGQIFARPDGGDPITISEVPEQYQSVGPGNYGGPEERIRNRFASFSGVVWGWAEAYTLDGSLISRHELGETRLTCGVQPTPPPTPTEVPPTVVPPTSPAPEPVTPQIATLESETPAPVTVQAVAPRICEERILVQRVNLGTVEDWDDSDVVSISGFENEPSDWLFENISDSWGESFENHPGLSWPGCWFVVERKIGEESSLWWSAFGEPHQILVDGEPINGLEPTIGFRDEIVYRDSATGEIRMTDRYGTFVRHLGVYGHEPEFDLYGERIWYRIPEGRVAWVSPHGFVAGPGGVTTDIVGAFPEQHPDRQLLFVREQPLVPTNMVALPEGVDIEDTALITVLPKSERAISIGDGDVSYSPNWQEVEPQHVDDPFSDDEVAVWVFPDAVRISDQASQPEVASQPAAIDSATCRIVATDGSNLNVRANPGTDSQIIGKLPNTEKVSVLEEDGDWIRIAKSQDFGESDSYWVAEWLTQPSSCSQ